MREPERAIEAVGIRKHFARAPEETGLLGLDLQVAAGAVHGLLGPNGAGNTTTIRILTILLAPDAGRATVAGYDVVTQARQVRQRIGLVGQSAAVDEILTGRQNLHLFGRLHRLATSDARRRGNELLERFALTEAASRPAGDYSGGMRRLDLAVSLIVAPAVLFVDEPTTGLDPLGRREVWTTIREPVATGTTVLLTTQYLEEADHLANRISILKSGRVIAEGTPDELKSAIDGDWLDVVLATTEDLTVVERIAARFVAATQRVDAAALRVSIPVDDRMRASVAVAAALRDAEIEPVDFALRRPTLDDVFLHLTGDGSPEVGTTPVRDAATLMEVSACTRRLRLSPRSLRCPALAGS